MSQVYIIITDFIDNIKHM